MNLEQKIFERVIKKRRHREWRLANLNRHKPKIIFRTSDKEFHPKKIGLLQRFFNWLKYVFRRRPRNYKVSITEKISTTEK